MNHQSPIRAPRKPLHLPVSYRVGAESAWRYGTTENVSRTGVLLRLDAPVRVATSMQIVFSIPPRVLDTAPCDLACTGLVRRVAASGTDHVVGVEFAQVAVDALDAVIARG